MLFRIADGNVVQHVCVQCAEDYDILTEEATWSEVGWCFFCGKMPGAKGDNPERRQATLRRILGLTGTETEGS
jgi:hypothetical protein